MEKSTVSLAVTSLSEHEMERVELLCRSSKKVRIRQCNAVSKQTTVCVVPADPKDSAMAKVRTAKAMRAALLGIPLVTPAWIEACLSSEDIVPPTAFLRSLPTKGGAKVGSACGVAHLAARKTGLLSKYQIFLCLPTRLQRDVIQLIKDAGGTVVSRLSLPADGRPLVVLCGDTDQNVSGAVNKAVTMNPENHLVVHSRWLFDSISHGSPLADLSYGPPSNKANALWKLCSQT